MRRKATFVPVVECLLFDARGEQANFNLTFYGVPLSEFMRDDGGNRIRKALERRGIFNLVSSPFHVFERRLNL